MTKKYLKTGMLAVTKGGDIFLIVLDLYSAQNTGKGVFIRKHGHMPISDYTDDLKYPSSDAYSIEKIYKAKFNNHIILGLHHSASSIYRSPDYDCIWERKEDKPILTLDGVDYSEDTLRSLIKKATHGSKGA